MDQEEMEVADDFSGISMTRKAKHDQDQIDCSPDMFASEDTEPIVRDKMVQSSSRTGGGPAKIEFKADDTDVVCAPRVEHPGIPTTFPEVKVNVDQFKRHWERKPRILPSNNCQEKIIICLDLSPEAKTVSLHEQSVTLFHLYKRLVKIFVGMKHRANKSHEYGIIIMNEENAFWLRNFTNEVSLIEKALDNLEEMPYTAENVNMSTLFDVIDEHVSLPTVLENSSAAPSYVIRIVFLYGRMKCIPRFLDGQKTYEKLERSPAFFFDAVYSPFTNIDDCDCLEIRDVLGNIDTKGHGLFYNPDSVTSIHNCMGKILGHPLQRPLQT